MTTLVLSPRFHDDSQKMWRAAIARNWNVHRAIRYMPPYEPGGTDDVCCVYGEVSFCDIMAERLDLGLLEPPVDWLGTLPEELVKRVLWTGTIADLGKVQSRSFIKPANDKVFAAAVYEKGSDVPTRYVDSNCPIVVSEVVAFDIEVRLYVKDGKIATADYYRLVGETTEEEALSQAMDFARPHLSSFDLPSSVVVDVGHIEGRGWAFVEANQLYASGIYGNADPEKILDLVLRAAGPLSRVSIADRKFLRR
jgi:hypothetical protein